MECAQTCCFTGHRPEKLPWGTQEDHPHCMALKQSMALTLQTLVLQGRPHFICGMARGADFYFAEAVLALRSRYPEVTLEAALPCLGQADKWSDPDRLRWHRLVTACNTTTLVQERYDRFCMLRRDRYMVDRSHVLLAVFNGVRGGTQYTLDYAARHHREVYLFDLNHPHNPPTHLTHKNSVHPLDTMPQP